MPSNEHDRLASMAIRWIRNRSSSMRGALEVRLGNGYVADAVAVGGLQWRFYESYCKKWGVQTDRYRPGGGLRKEESEIKTVPCSFIHVFEAKSTRSDFLSTFGKNAKQSHANRMIPAGTTHWVVVDPNVCTVDEVPDLWGLLVRRGNGLSEIKLPNYGLYCEQRWLEVNSRILWKPSLYRAGVGTRDG